jgi:hypothetical protein
MATTLTKKRSTKFIPHRGSIYKGAVRKVIPFSTTPILPPFARSFARLPMRLVFSVLCGDIPTLFLLCALLLLFLLPLPLPLLRTLLLLFTFELTTTILVALCRTHVAKYTAFKANMCCDARLFSSESEFEPWNFGVTSLTDLLSSSSKLTVVFGEHGSGKSTLAQQLAAKPTHSLLAPCPRVMLASCTQLLTALRKVRFVIVILGVLVSCSRVMYMYLHTCPCE